MIPPWIVGILVEGIGIVVGHMGVLLAILSVRMVGMVGVADTAWSHYACLDLLRGRVWAAMLVVPVPRVVGIMGMIGIVVTTWIPHTILNLLLGGIDDRLRSRFFVVILATAYRKAGYGHEYREDYRRFHMTSLPFHSLRFGTMGDDL